jgi:HD superfamily phosphodiesterase
MTGKVISALIRFYGNDRRRIAHALKVYAYADTIAELENFSPNVRETLAYAAILHDAGIKIGEEKYGSCTHRQQEEEGPSIAREILCGLDISSSVIERVCFLIAHHHSPQASEDKDFRALLEADFIVNFEEGDIPLSSLQETSEKHFRTKSGLALLRMQFSQ